MCITIIAHIAGYLMKDAVGAAEETSYMWIVYTVTGVLSFMLLIILVVFLAIRQSKRGKLVIKQGKAYSKHFLTHPKKKKKDQLRLKCSIFGLNRPYSCAFDDSYGTCSASVTRIDPSQTNWSAHRNRKGCNHFHHLL